MPLPWIIGGLVVAGITAIASSNSDEEEREERRRRERRRERREAEESAKKDKERRIQEEKEQVIQGAINKIADKYESDVYIDTDWNTKMTIKDNKKSILESNIENLTNENSNILDLIKDLKEHTKNENMLIKI